MATQVISSAQPTMYKRLLANKYARMGILGLVLLVFAVFSGAAYAFAMSPTAIRSPQFEHAHFRMDVVVDGKPINFGDKKYQEGYSKDNCNADLTKTPIHFHDNKNHFVHLHWQHMTGGMVLKYYGWNRIGGTDGLLGYRFDKGTNLETVPIYGRVLPAPPKGATLYVYSGTADKFTQRNLDDFLNQDTETFFDKQSNVTKQSAGLWERLFPTASAHNSVDHGLAGESVHDEERLTRINNLLGNVVLFMQDKEPSDEQIQARFNALEPLSESSCGG